MMRRWRLPLVLALLAGAGACGDGGGGATPEEQSIVVITLNLEVGVPELRQIRVNAHLANPAMSNDLFFPTVPAGPIQSGSTLALLLPTTHVFEGMRATLATGRPAFAPLLPAFALNAVYLALAGAFFGWMMSRVREKGYLARLAME